MKPVIQSTSFGSIEIDSVVYRHDITIGLDGMVRRRNKALSKAKYGTSHTIAYEEALDVYEPGAEKLIIGSGAFGRVHLSEEASQFLIGKNCQVELQPTGKAGKLWNSEEGRVLALFHITC